MEETTDLRRAYIRHQNPAAQAVRSQDSMSSTPRSTSELFVFCPALGSILVVPKLEMTSQTYNLLKETTRYTRRRRSKSG